LPYLRAYAYLGHRKEDFPVSLKASSEILSLPLFPELAEVQILYMAQQIREFVG
jgi:UDP-2-acetamido-2-deoxy-ribo-hexuluronate aminotransferase